MSDNTEIAKTATKLQQLQSIAEGNNNTLDSSGIKSKIAMFLLAHADKVMDTVAPLEALRDVLSESYAEKVQQKLEDPELTPGQVARMITDIQTMNTYSLTALKSIIDADKLQSVIAVDTSTKIEGATINVLNLPDAASRSRVLRALQQISTMDLDNNTGNSE